MLRRSASPVVCSIGSVDPTAAAGITLDLAVYASMGARGASVVTGVTAQNAKQVATVHPIPPAVIARQLELIWEQVCPDAICIGLVPGAQGISTVARFLHRLRPRPTVVVDPVITASSGGALLGPSAMRALPQLLRVARIITPNVPEAALLSSREIATLQDAAQAAQTLTRWGCAVLVTGGHLGRGDCVDALAVPECGRTGLRRRSVQRFASSRLPGALRGAGGILAAAIAVELGRGRTLERAVMRARRVVRDAWRTARPLGGGTPQFVAI
jgi:hydroxymethylpyrimidine/phosphomethylpyrimidine kinase